MADGYRFHVDRTAILTFASAVGETNRIFWDEDYAASTPLEGVIAPPTFAAASAHWDPNYFLRGIRQIPAQPETPATPAAGSAPEKSEKDGDGGGGGIANILHAEQRYEYHRPLRPGMSLTVTTRAGERWSKQGRRGGTLHFGETVSEFRDDDGNLVMTATNVGVRTGKVVENP
jgi:hypothetical protein